jgi:hypothetical protein
MALVLGVEEGQSVYIGDRRVVLEKIHSPFRFMIRVEGPHMDNVFELTDSERTQILPNVYAQAGTGGNLQVVKIAFEAAPNTVILRERLYNARQ